MAFVASQRKRSFALGAQVSQRSQEAPYDHPRRRNRRRNLSHPTLARLAELCPQTLATMHGSAYRGDGAALLRQLSEALSEPAGVH